MTDEFDRLIWAYRAVFTQANAGGGSIVVSVKMKERTVILYGIIGPDDYAADRTIVIYSVDAVGGNVTAILASGTNLDNTRLHFPGPAGGANAETEFNNRVVLSRDEIIQITTGALVQNETLTVTIRALVSSALPSVETTGSGGTITTVTTYNKVI